MDLKQTYFHTKIDRLKNRIRVFGSSLAKIRLRRKQQVNPVNDSDEADYFDLYVPDFHDTRQLPAVQRSGQMFSMPQGGTHANDPRLMMEATAWDLPLDRVSLYFNLAMVALVVGAIITIAATIALVWLSGLRSRYADQRFATALFQSDQAKADAARANERAAELLLQARQAQVEQEKTKLELEHTRAVTGARRLSPDQQLKIVKALSGRNLTVNVMCARDDAEANQFAHDITATLKNAGLNVTFATSLFASPVRGLAMSVSSDGSNVLSMAFRSAGLEVQDLPDRNPVMIAVGSKPAAN